MLEVLTTGRENSMDIDFFFLMTKKGTPTKKSFPLATRKSYYLCNNTPKILFLKLVNYRLHEEIKNKWPFK